MVIYRSAGFSYEKTVYNEGDAINKKDFSDEVFESLIDCGYIYKDEIKDSDIDKADVSTSRKNGKK
jgi:hypothetical protein